MLFRFHLSSVPSGEGTQEVLWFSCRGACTPPPPLNATLTLVATSPVPRGALPPPAVTLDNGRKFDLTSDSFADDGNVEAGRAAQFLRRGQPSGGSGSGSKRASKVVRGTKKGKRPARDRAEGGDRPVEAEFRDK